MREEREVIFEWWIYSGVKKLEGEKRYFTNISDLSEELRMSEEKRDDTWVIKGKGLKFVKKEKLKYILLDVK